MNYKLMGFVLASVLLFQAPLATQLPAELDHYFCDWDNLRPLLGAFSDGSLQTFSRTILGVTYEPPVSISFARDGYIYAGVGEFFCSALRDLLSDAVAKGDRWPLELFVNTVNADHLVKCFQNSMPGGLFNTKLSIEPGLTQDQLALSVFIENSRGGMAGRVTLAFESIAPSLRGVHIPGPSPFSSWFKKPDLPKVLSPIDTKDKIVTPSQSEKDQEKLAALAQRAEEIDSTAGTSGLLDQALKEAGSFPFALGKAPVVTKFPGFPAEDPCNPESWTLPIVAWSTSHFTQVFKPGSAPSSSSPKRPPARPLTPADIENYQKTVYRAMESMRLLCGATTEELAPAFDKVWAPFLDQPNAEAFDYFNLLNPLLDRYWGLYSKIEADLEAGRQAWQQAGVAAGMLDESGTQAALDNGFMITQRLKKKREEAARVMGEIVDLGDPPNPLQSKCDARGRHQAALDALGPSGSSAGSSWVMVDYVMKDEFLRADGYKKESTSVIYDRPDGSIGGNYDYEIQWIHPPGRLEPGAMIELPVNSVRTGLDRHQQTAILDVPRIFKPGVKGVLSALTQVRYPTEDYFHFVLTGGLSTWLDGEKALMEIRLFPHAGVNRARLEPYDRGQADWAGERIYRYEWDSTGTRRPFDPGASSGGSVAGLPTVAAAPPPTPTAPPIQPSPEVAAAIVEHQQTLGTIRRNLQRASEELAREKDPNRRIALEDEVVMHQANIQEEQDRIESLRTGKIVHSRTVWEQREEQRFLDKIRTEVDLLSAETKWVAGLPKMAENLEYDSYGTRQKIFRDVQSIYGSGLSLEERVSRLRQIGASIQARTEGEQKVAHEKLQVAENRMWYAEKISTAANLGIMAGALLVPGGGFVAMGYGVGSGWAEGGPAKAAENTIRALSPAVDLGWAAYDGYFAQERDPATGKLRYRGWWGAAENMAITYVTNKVFDKLGERMQSHPPADIPGMGQTGAFKGSRGAGQSKVGPEPRVDAFEENVTRFKNALEHVDRGFDDFYPKTADSKIDTSHPNYGKAKEMHEKAVAQVREKYGVVAKREDLKADLSASTKKYEAMIPKEARNPDGTVNAQHPDYQRVKGEWEADMKAIREKHNQGFDARWKEQEAILKDIGLDPDKTLSGGKPKSIMSDIDLTAKDMESGNKFIQGMKDKGHSVLEFSDRWVIPGTDTTIWKPNARPEKIGSAAHSASVDYFTSRGSDKFPTEGGVAFTTGNAAGVEDPAGAVISNLKKATEAGIGGNTAEPDYHIIGKSCDKAAEVANKYDPSKPIQDPEFFEKAKGVREHKTPEEAGVMTFGNPPEAKKGESQKFLSSAQGHMNAAMKSGEAASQKLNAENLQMIATFEAAGDKKTANRIREMLVRARVSNEAAMQSLSRQDPAFISQIHRGLATVPPPPPSPPPPGRKFGYGWLLESTKKLNAQPLPDAGAAAPPLEATMKAASQAIDKEALSVLKAESPEKTYFQSIKNAFDAGGTNPVYAGRAVRAASGYEMAKVAADMASLGARKKGSGGGGHIGNPLAPAPGFTNVPPIENPDLAGMKAVWVYHRLPILSVEVGPLGYSNSKRIEKQIAPRVAIVPPTEIFWTAGSVRATLKGSDPKYPAESVVSIAVDPKGEKLAVLQTDENSQTLHMESWALCRVHDLPLVEKKVFGNNPRFYAWVYRSEGDALQPLLAKYEYGSNHSWDEGRWKWRFQAIRWDDKINMPRCTVVFCSVHPSKFDELIRNNIITVGERSEFETWIDRQRGWEPIVIPKK